MTGARTTRVSRVVGASRGAVYAAWLDARALAAWLPPSGMRGDVREVDPREGGGYRMTLTYERAEHPVRGKTSEHTDAVRARFVQLIPDERIVQAVRFDATDPDLAGEMTMTVTLADADEGTEVTVLCEHIPPGIRLEDNEMGCRSSLENLAAFLRRPGP